VRTRYEALLKSVTDPDATRIIRARLDVVGREEELASTVREFERVLDKSRLRDREVDRIEKRLAAAEQPGRRPFVAEGLVQTSSRRIDGKRVLALIGPEGAALAYLDVPDGLDVRPLLSRRVGVRGDMHYNEALHARLISVRSIEPLDVERR
jgi:hypothetical protein